jgi:glycerol-3-phosphate dehydrogenase
VPVGDNGVPLKEIAEYPTADVRSIVDNEWVVHLSDVARRRTLLTLLGRAAEPTLRELADVLGDRLGWDEGRRASEVQACLSASA